MRYRKMSEKQLLVYGARIRLAWFRKAEELGTVTAACRYYGIPRRTYYYWYTRWVDSGKLLTSLYEQPRTPKSHPEDVDEETVSLIIQLRLGWDMVKMRSVTYSSVITTSVYRTTASGTS
jgi:hypothetical protein